MRTEYTAKNAEFSNLAHLAAQRLIYPFLFRCDPAQLSFESTLLETSEKNKILDGEMAVDRIVTVTVSGLHAPLSMTIQERFRRPEFSKYQDVTITEWNGASGLPSELYKIKAGYFVYGYYDDRQDLFTDAIAISVPDLQLRIIRGEIKYGRGVNKKQQSFFTFGFNELHRCNLIRYRQNTTTYRKENAHDGGTGAR